MNTSFPYVLRRNLQFNVAYRILIALLFVSVINLLFVVEFSFERRVVFGTNIDDSASAVDSARDLPHGRLEFVHITKTGGSAIEKAGAKHGIIWGACHYMAIPEVGCNQPDIFYEPPDYVNYHVPGGWTYINSSPWHAPPKILEAMVANSTLYPYEGADLFTVVRNPYSRFVSEYYCPFLGYKYANINDPKIMNEWILNTVSEAEKTLLDINSRKPDGPPEWQPPQKLTPEMYLLDQKHYINQAEYIFDGEEKIIKHVVHYENMDEEFRALMEEYGLDISLPDKKNDGTYTNKWEKLTYLDLDPETIAAINRYAAPDFERLGYEMVHHFDRSAVLLNYVAPKRNGEIKKILKT